MIIAALLFLALALALTSAAMAALLVLDGRQRRHRAARA